MNIEDEERQSLGDRVENQNCVDEKLIWIEVCIDW